jgi:hypothetical protein
MGGVPSLLPNAIVADLSKRWRVEGFQQFKSLIERTQNGRVANGFASGDPLVTQSRRAVSCGVR